MLSGGSIYIGQNCNNITLSDIEIIESLAIDDGGGICIDNLNVNILLQNIVINTSRTLTLSDDSYYYSYGSGG